MKVRKMGENVPDTMDIASNMVLRVFRRWLKRGHQSECRGPRVAGTALYSLTLVSGPRSSISCFLLILRVQVLSHHFQLCKLTCCMLILSAWFWPWNLPEHPAEVPGTGYHLWKGVVHIVHIIGACGGDMRTFLKAIVSGLGKGVPYVNPQSVP